MIAQIYCELVYFQMINFLEITIIKFPGNNNNFLHELALYSFQVLRPPPAPTPTSIHTSQVGQILLFSFLVKKQCQKGKLINLKGHILVNYRVGNNTSLQTLGPQLISDSQGSFPHTTHSGANCKSYLALFYSQKMHEEFEQFSKWCIFQCNLILRYRGIKSTDSFHCMCQLCGDSSTKCILTSLLFTKAAKLRVCQFP